jgi:hypothetical protein
MNVMKTWRYRYPNKRNLRCPLILPCFGASTVEWGPQGTPRNHIARQPRLGIKQQCFNAESPIEPFLVKNAVCVSLSAALRWYCQHEGDLSG